MKKLLSFLLLMWYALALAQTSPNFFNGQLVQNYQWNQILGAKADYPFTSGTSIVYGNGLGGVSNVTIGSGLMFSGGTLTATGSGGSVTSVGLSMPTGFTVTNSPVTTSGTLTVTTALSGILKGSSGAITTATSGTDYAPATSGTSIVYGNGAGGFSNVTIGTGLTFGGGTLATTGGSGTVTSIDCAATLTCTASNPITASGTITINLANANTWTAAQTHSNSDLLLLGSSTGATTFTSANSSATAYTMTIPANSGTLAELNLAETWAAAQTFNNSDIKLLGSSTGATTFTSANASSTAYTLTFPAVTDTLATIGTAQTWTAAQSFPASGILLKGSSTGYTTFVSANASGTAYTVTFPAATDTVAELAATQTLTNKSIAGSEINSGTVGSAYGGAGTISGIMKANGSGTVSAANSGTDYAPATSGSSILYGNGSGGFSNVTIGTGLSFSGGTLTNSSSGAIRDYIAGFILSTAGSSATMSIAAGQATDSTNAISISLSAFSKTTSSWASGSGNGGLDTGSIAINTWYKFYVINGTDGTDVIFTTAALATGPSMPSGYTYFRYIGSGKTNGSSQWTSFTQNGNDFRWITPPLDANATPLTTAYSNITLTVPTGIIVQAYGNIAGIAGDTYQIRPVFASDGAPNSTTSPLATISGNGVALTASGKWFAWTNASSQIQAASNSSNNVYITTEGWVDPRGQNN